MKKYSLVLIVLVSLMTLAAAALVPYLSGKITADVSIQSPMECGFGDYSTKTLSLGSLASSEKVEFSTICKANADVEDVYGIMLQITGPTTWSGNEFTSVNLADSRYGGLPGEILSNLCYVDNESIAKFSELEASSGSTIKLFYSHDGSCNVDSAKFDYSSTTVIGNNITMTPALNIAPGTYTVKMCYVSDFATGDCE
jgi:hypothetical protein